MNKKIYIYIVIDTYHIQLTSVCCFMNAMEQFTSDSHLLAYTLVSPNHLQYEHSRSDTL